MKQIQSVNGIWSVCVILHKKKFHQKILKKLRPENYFQVFCVCKELSTATIGKRNF